MPSKVHERHAGAKTSLACANGQQCYKMKRFYAGEKLGFMPGRGFIPGVNANVIDVGFYGLRKNSVLYQGTTLVMP
jgi:hypothetical protein